MTALDEPTLAGCARQALADARGGTLHIDGVATGSVDTSDAVFYDEDGRPTFLCAPGSAIGAAATTGRVAILTVPAARTAAASALSLRSVLLAGQLSVVGEQQVDGASVAIVGLEVGSVVVEQLVPDGAGVARRSVPLTAWTSATATPVEQAARRLVEHANGAHGAELRVFAAGLAKTDRGSVLSAELVELDTAGFVVAWIDGSGGHRLRVRFRSAAHCPASLHARLRESLAGRAV